MISHFVRQANKSHAVSNNNNNARTINFTADARLLPISTFQLEHASETDHPATTTTTMQCTTKSATKRAKARARECSLLAWQAQLISYCNCITTETRCYGKFPLVVVVGAALLLLLLLLFLLLCVRITADLLHAVAAADCAMHIDFYFYLSKYIFIQLIDFLL